MPTINSVLSEVDQLNPNMLDPGTKVGFVSKVEGRVLSEIMDKCSEVRIEVNRNQYVYQVEGVSHDYDIVKILLNDRVIPKINLKEDITTTGCYIIPGEPNVSVELNTVSEGTLKVIVQTRQSKLDIKVDKDKELLIPSPYDDVYIHYVNAMVCHYTKDDAGYNSNIHLYNNSIDAFKKWYLKREPKTYSKARNVW